MLYLHPLAGIMPHSGFCMDRGVRRDAIQVSIFHRRWDCYGTGTGRDIRDDTDMHSIAAANTAANCVSLPDGRQVMAGNHPFPYLLFDHAKQCLGAALYQQTTVIHNHDVSRCCFYIRDDMRGENHDALAARSERRVRKRARSSGSRPTVGSSTMSSCGSFNNACAMPMRCFMPPE